MSSKDQTGSPTPPSDNPMQALLDADTSMTMPMRGEMREGVIARITNNEILVDVGAKSEGMISGREFDSIDEPTRKALTVGQTVLIYVLDPEDRNGNIQLSMTRAKEEKDWRQAEELLGSQEAFGGQIAGFNKGGLIVKLGNVRGFVPSSQISQSRRRRSEGAETPEQKWAKMVGEAVTVKVIEVDRSRNRLILSERAAAKETREAEKERLLGEIKPGDLRKGRVMSLAEFGAFIDLGGADGLVHLSELSWKRLTHPNELLKIGQEVEVVVMSVDKERKRIALSMKRREEDPWTVFQKKHQIGQLVSATITKLAKFGAFARIDGADEIEGLIPMPELSDSRLEHPKEVVKEGQQVTLRIVKIEAENRRVGLSLKRASSAEYAEADLQKAAENLNLDEVAATADDEK